MSRSIRIRTEPNGGDKRLKVQINQDFDYLEILSLKISQEDVYRSFYSDYGVVVGRVIMNSGVGVPNARVSIFIPLTDEDAENPELSSIYPFKDLQDVNSDGIRYNTLPNDAQGVCHAPIGTFPTKRELVDNPELLEVYGKYFKYTTTTNGAGDFMLFGVPVGNHMVNVDVDLSDMGIFSQRPYDFIEDGNPKKLFESPTKFKTGTNLNNLTQVKNRQVGVNVIPFWGEKESNEIGISRIDVDINYNIKPKAIFMGAIFGDNEKQSVNKNCRPRRKMGNVCEMGEGEGTIQMLRKTIYGDNERFDVEGGRVINENGTWAYQIPMNLDYMVTDEFGVLSPTDDPTKGIPTRARTRFKISLDQTGGEGRLRTRANHLVPHNPQVLAEVDYTFDDTTSDVHFRDLYWNKIYTVKNHIARWQKTNGYENRNFVGFKDVDDCVGVKTPPPFNKMDTDFNPIYLILCVIMTIILTIISGINNVITLKILDFWPINGIRPFCGIGCIKITCPLDSLEYSPGCRGNCQEGDNSDYEDAKDCFRLALALALNIFEFDFYNDWLNGSLYAFLFKYKKPKNSGHPKYCGDGNNDSGFILNTNPVGGNIETDDEFFGLEEGIIAGAEDDGVEGLELFYKPLTKAGHRFYSTDIYNLGAIFPCDWQDQHFIQPDLIPTTYQIPPLMGDGDNIDENDVTPIDPLFFNLNCIKPKSNNVQSRSIRRICEIGVGLDEPITDDDGNVITPPNGEIDNTDIDNQLLRKKLIKLNTPELSGFNLDNINDEFDVDEYADYRNRVFHSQITQYFGDSFFFYFGTKPENSALNLMNAKYFTDCSRNVKNVIIINGNVTNVTIVDGQDGAIAITVFGGTPSYIYTWFDNDDFPISNGNGGNTPTVFGLGEGSYYVEVIDNNGEGVKAKKTFVVDGLQPLTADIVARNVSQTGQSNGKLIINSIIGGVSPYDIAITGPVASNHTDISFSLTVDNLPQGTYNILVTDSNDPAATYPETITISVPDPLNVNEVLFDPRCFDYSDGSILVTIEGGTQEYLVNMTKSNGSSVGVSSQSQSPPWTYLYDSLRADTYSLIVTDVFNQSYSNNIQLIENQLGLTFEISGFDLIILLTGSIDGVQYELINQNGDIQATPVGQGPNTQQIHEVILGVDIQGWRVRSEHGCQSNSL